MPSRFIVADRWNGAGHCSTQGLTPTRFTTASKATILKRPAVFMAESALLVSFLAVAEHKPYHIRSGHLPRRAAQMIARNLK